MQWTRRSCETNEHNLESRTEGQKRISAEKLTRARLRSSSWAVLTFSFLPPHALKTEACKARPYEKVKAHGRFGWLLMAFKLTEASSSDWPPDKKVTPKKKEEKLLNFI